MGRQIYERFVCACGEACLMIPHEKSGKLAPITTATYDDGNIEKDLQLDARGNHLAGRAVYRIVPKAERESNPKPRHLNHFSNCPNRDQFGGRKPG